MYVADPQSPITVEQVEIAIIHCDQCSDASGESHRF